MEMERRDDIILTLTHIAANASGWMKFLGIVSIISGALSAVSVVGIIFAWLPIWIGIILFQSGSRANEALIYNDPRKLVEMMNKLRTYFVIQGILMLIMIGFFIFVIFMLGVAGISLSQFFETV
jgi:hypothetical protein